MASARAWRFASRISARRPGVRDPLVELALKRRERVEAVASRHAGVRRTYAIQAGRELLVIVDPAKVSEKAASKLAREVAKAVQEEGPGPGEVQVTVVRETRASEVAV